MKKKFLSRNKKKTANFSRENEKKHEKNSNTYVKSARFWPPHDAQCRKISKTGSVNNQKIAPYLPNEHKNNKNNIKWSLAVKF